jgi:hypothetical protein
VSYAAGERAVVRYAETVRTPLRGIVFGFGIKARPHLAITNVQPNETTWRIQNLRHILQDSS